MKTCLNSTIAIFGTYTSGTRAIITIYHIEIYLLEVTWMIGGFACFCFFDFIFGYFLLVIGVSNENGIGG